MCMLVYMLVLAGKERATTLVLVWFGFGLRFFFSIRMNRKRRGVQTHSCSESNFLELNPHCAQLEARAEAWFPMCHVLWLR